MNTRDPLLMPDVQSEADVRQIAIDRVGIRSIRHPVTVLERSGARQSSIARFSMAVALPHHVKGTHMSRFVRLLNEDLGAIDSVEFSRVLHRMLEQLEARSGQIELSFPFFMRKQAPVSGVSSLMDYEVTLSGTLNETAEQIELKVLVPVTSLCPCSKEISDQGAHNQRSHVTLTVQWQPGAGLAIEDLIELAEAQASSELYGLLKRTDEKYVTERAYDNPKFVEDLARDLAAALAADRRINGFRVEVENFESIHNHSAWAQIDSCAIPQRFLNSN